MSQLTHEERLDILSASLAASARGDHAVALKIAQQEPMVPWVAKGIKEIFGTEYLKGWDLSEAEAEYGQDWLDR